MALYDPYLEGISLFSSLFFFSSSSSSSFPSLLLRDSSSSLSLSLESSCIALLTHGSTLPRLIQLRWCGDREDSQSASLDCAPNSASVCSWCRGRGGGEDGGRGSGAVADMIPAVEERREQEEGGARILINTHHARCLIHLWLFYAMHVMNL